jgi:hypothetical protein
VDQGTGQQHERVPAADERGGRGQHAGPDQDPRPGVAERRDRHGRLDDRGHDEDEGDGPVQ